MFYIEIKLAHLGLFVAALLNRIAKILVGHATGVRPCLCPDECPESCYMADLIRNVRYYPEQIGRGGALEDALVHVAHYGPRGEDLPCNLPECSHCTEEDYW